MKTTLKIFILLVILSTTLGCKKQVSEAGLSGTWEFRSMVGGMLAKAPDSGTPGNGNTIKFEGNTFEQSVGGKVTRSGTFTFAKEDKSINTNSANAYINFSDTNEKVYINLSKNKLILFYGVIAADGVEITYEKL